jgi:hypothetical protein
MLPAGALGLVLLTYCGVRQEEASDSAGELPTTTTFPSLDAGGERTAYDLAPGSQVLLQGTTNISDWSSGSSQASARVVLGADKSAVRSWFDKLQNGQISAGQLRILCACPATAELSVPVMSLQGDSQGMDRDLHSALKATQFPFIQYRFDKVQDAQMRPDPVTGNPIIWLRVVGALTVAGVQRTLASDLTIERAGNGHYHVQARIPVQMTDFSVAPPTAFVGIIRARDSLCVIFDLDFISSDPPGNPATR